MTELDKKLAKAARECSADAVRRTFEALISTCQKMNFPRGLELFRRQFLINKEQRQ